MSRGVELSPEQLKKGLQERDAVIESLRAELEECRTQYERLERVSNVDPVTELHNHRYFQEQLSAELARSQRFHRPLSTLLVDIDRFNAFNEEFGHATGDVLLRNVASVLRDKLREVDIVTRYGGDEFAVILPETGSNDAAMIAERIRKAVELPRLTAPEEGEISPSATVTIGVASYPRHSRTKDGLLVTADIALCSGKQASGNRVSLYAPVQFGNSIVDPFELYQLVHNPTMARLVSLASAVDAREKGTQGHSERVSRYALQTAWKLGLSKEETEHLRIAGLLHDVGKLGVVDRLIFKPGSLSQDERRCMQEHAAMSKSILERVPGMESILPAVLHHHERWDGSGYPNGLSGEQIPLPARILGVADAYDAMTSDRPHRKSMSREQAIAELRQHAGEQFDADVVAAFVEAIEQNGRTKKAA